MPECDAIHVGVTLTEGLLTVEVGTVRLTLDRSNSVAMSQTMDTPTKLGDLEEAVKAMKADVIERYGGIE